MYEDADAATDGSTEETHRDVHDEAERSTTHRDASIKVNRWSASVHEQLALRAGENNQRTSQDNEDVHTWTIPRASSTSLHT